uniref:Odorant receptor n=1 Tax=Heortia vitessoides TaxID=1557813 RepID=A0A978W732_9NEOP|nr:odorant receptor 35 [Heortia vitessoides]
MKIISRSTIDKFTYTLGERNEVDQMMSFTLLIQRLLGQQMLDPCWTCLRFWLHHVFGLALIIYVLFGTIHFLKNTTNDKLIAEACYTFVVTFSFPLKYILFVFNKRVFRELYLEVKTTLYEVIKKNSVDGGKSVLEKVKKRVYLLYGLTMCPVTSYVATAIWCYLNGKRITVSKTTSILMPMKTPYHEIGLILHSIFMFSISSVVIVIDMWFVLLMYFFCLSIDGTKNMLNISARTSGESQLEYALRLNAGLRNFYNTHVKQVEYLHKMNIMFKWLGLLPLIYLAINGCIIFLLLRKGVDWTFASNMLPVFAELFAYNWFGEQIKVKMQELNLALLNFDWTNMELKDKKCYFIIVSYMNKAFSLKTAIGTDLSLITMTEVLKVSYQTCTVLQTMD